VPITLQEISNRDLAFSREWKHAGSEDADAKSFWDSFYLAALPKGPRCHDSLI
jgi:hypothetical protein